MELKDKLVSVNRITKVVKGGRRFAFSALVVVGNFEGSIGVGHGKAKQVPDAIKKATQSAKHKEIPAYTIGRPKLGERDDVCYLEYDQAYQS